MSSDIGIYGLTNQGVNLALNFASNGFLVTVGNKSSDKIKECIDLAEKADLEEKVRGIKDAAEFCKNLKTPRVVLLLAKPGSSIDRNLQKIAPSLEAGDIVIDGSCDSVVECDRRRAELEEKQVQYATMAIAGSDDDARKGPAFLVSGAKETFDAVEPMLSKVAAKMNDRACVGLVGSGSLAAFVKMLVDGLELGECELLAEQYDLQRQMHLNNPEMSETFSTWNEGEQASFLLATTATILAKKDTDVEGCKPSDNFLVDRIVDQAPAKRCAADVPGESVTATTSGSVLSSAMFARFASSSREERSKVNGTVKAPKFDWGRMDLQEVLRDLPEAYACERVVMYAQAFAMLAAAASKQQWEVKSGEVARVLSGGNVLRGKLLESIAEVFEKEPATENLLASEKFATLLKEKQCAWRRVMSLTVMAGVTAPTGMAALSYYDAMCTKRLPGAMVQCLRDCLLEEGFERVDKEKGELFSCRWNK
ncbi:hypothetical protein WA538_000003 [Blastocystis sp. DL]